jgi:hypothetical protein
MPKMIEVIQILETMSTEDALKMHFSCILIFYIKSEAPETWQSLPAETRDKLESLFRESVERRVRFEKYFYKKKLEMELEGTKEEVNRGSEPVEKEFVDFSEIFASAGLSFLKEHKIGMYFWDYFFPSFFKFAQAKWKSDPRHKDLFRTLERFKDHQFVLELQGTAHFKSGYQSESAMSQFKTRLSSRMNLIVLKMNFWFYNTILTPEEQVRLFLQQLPNVTHQALQTHITDQSFVLQEKPRYPALSGSQGQPPSLSSPPNAPHSNHGQPK